MKNQLVIIVLIIAALLGGAFYWYEYKPSRVRASCEAESYEFARAQYREQQDAYDFKFNSCLNRHGLR
ncbi:MAG: hypothetical protein WEA04_01005 [Candidatus Andersenbacteria bacterium]